MTDIFGILNIGKTALETQQMALYHLDEFVWINLRRRGLVNGWHGAVHGGLPVCKGQRITFIAVPLCNRK